jgi:acetylornithine/succinyldiaminopimelate/putrescine aminotransferase
MTKRRAPKVPLDDLDDRAVTGGEGVDDDFEVVSLATTFGGAALALPITPAAMRKLSAPAAIKLNDLQNVVRRRLELLDEMDELVGQLRAVGVSWNLIGWSVGTTSEAARQRWS